MFPGPIFTRELRIASKRWATFSERTGGLWILLVVLIAAVVVWRILEWDNQTPWGMRQFTLLVFGMVSIVTGGGLIGVAPAVVAPILAGERDRKSLDAVLAARLSSLEIVLGALAAGMVRMLSGVLTLLPMLLLMGPLGGVDLRLVVLAYAGMLALAFNVAALAIACSAVSRNTKRAAAYSLLISSWMFIPVVAVILLPRIWPWGARWLHPVLMWLVESSPMGLVVNIAGVFRSSSLLEAVGRMIVGQMVIGLAAVIWAVIRLRPASRAVHDAEGRSALLRMLRVRWGKRPPCGDDPVLWNEMYSTRGVRNWEIVLGLVIAVPMLLGLAWGTFLLAKPAFLELPTFGYSASPEGNSGDNIHPLARTLVNTFSNTRSTGFARVEFNVILRHASLLFFFIYEIVLAGFAAEGLVLERERDTLSGLLVTRLRGSEILRAKMLGAVWRTRSLLIVIGAIWLVGLACGGLHPLGLLLTLLGLAVSTWFFTALGTLGSLWSKNRAEANNRILLPVMLLLCSALLLIPVPAAGWQPRIWMATASTPVTGSLGLLSYDDIRAIARAQPFPGLETIGVGSKESAGTVAMTWMIGFLAQAIAAFVLTRAAILGFDRAVGRPTLTRRSPHQDQLVRTPSPASRPSPVASGLSTG
jgi:ABC-type Na+ efflux pump permease subunit